MSGLLSVLGLVLWGTLCRLLSMRPAVPGGLELNRREAPGFFAELDGLCARIGSAQFDGVLLSQFCNAHVATGPRPGVSGWRRYLVVGVPLLQGMSADEVRAVLAHEIAHRGEHSALTRWVERVRAWTSALAPDPIGNMSQRPRSILEAPAPDRHRKPSGWPRGPDWPAPPPSTAPASHPARHRTAGGGRLFTAERLALRAQPGL